jgi:hypothetical protein
LWQRRRPARTWPSSTAAKEIMPLNVTEASITAMLQLEECLTELMN